MQATDGDTMPSTYERMMAAIDAYQKRTGLSDVALSKAMGFPTTYIFYLRQGRQQGTLDRADAVIKFCEGGE
jgi:hypothetical protein